ncbi:MAG: hypothetical protein EOP83_15915 [Verrucomicrobiaceae bacterium]|nr:MAG: hypothetical protein EOP83_15915 [Verrucomicrobiaceae bacterium]
MICIGHMADGIRYDMKLVVCPANSHLYVRIKVEEEMFCEDDGFTMIDYVPISPGELVDLKTRASLEMLDRIQELSIGRTCIATTRGAAQWMDRVFYPHT